MSVRPAREGNTAGERHHMENTTPVFSPWSAAAPTQHSHRCPLGRARIRLCASAPGSTWSFILPAQTCSQSWHTPMAETYGGVPWVTPPCFAPSACQGMVLDIHSQTPAHHSGSQLALSRSQEIPHQPRVLPHGGDPHQCLVTGSKPSTEAGEEGAPRTPVASRKGGDKQSGKIRAEITAQAVTSSGAAAPSLGGHCHPGDLLPLFSMARAAQPSLAEHLQLPQTKSPPWNIQGPQGSTKAFLKKLGFTLRIHSCERGGGQGRRGDVAIPNPGGQGSRGRAQAPPPRPAAQAATTEGRDCRQKDISFSQPKSTLKGQNPQTVPKSRGWCWEGTAAWQQQGTDQSCHSQLQQLEPSHSIQSCSPGGVAHGRAGRGRRHGKAGDGCRK